MSVTHSSSIDSLLKIMARLRDPAGGCPWDLEQDFHSIAPYTLEEAYEVVDTIESGRPDELCAELGDLLFQVVFHAQLASEADWFDFEEVVQGICDKMTCRHPHVFADAVIDDAAAQTRAWERHKQQERGEQQSVLAGVPVALPALTRANKLQGRAARVGFDWPDVEGVQAKVVEELAELRHEIDTQAGPKALAEEAGDLLFAAVNLVRHAGIDPEQALRQGNRKFERRFREVEAMCAADGVVLSTADIDTLERYWQLAKERERSKGGG
ncbi:MAG: nucleoside triphosphate pyrophosphohydrolase [Gammaproteobacteria bacterium]|nr:nucleoside triphosphate pyrophosphohydrolase [Gammaproteobacteria bacterium]